MRADKPNCFHALSDLLETVEASRSAVAPSEAEVRVDRGYWLGIISRIREVGDAIDSINTTRLAAQDAAAAAQDQLHAAKSTIAGASDWLRQIDWNLLRAMHDKEYGGHGHKMPDYPASELLVALQNAADILGLEPLDTGANIQTGYEVKLNYEFSVFVEHDRDADPEDVENMAVDKAVENLGGLFGSDNATADSFAVKKITDVPF
jgi:hypothetical protein